MLERLAFGDLPPKHHVALRGEGGELRYEECLTRAGFEGQYTISYHLNRPQSVQAKPTLHALTSPQRAWAPADSLRRRHFRTGALGAGGPPITARVPLLFSDDVVVSASRPTESDPAYRVNADGDELWFVRRGRGALYTPLGSLPFGPLDYVGVPKGLLHRVELDPETEHDYLVIECKRGLEIPRHFRNEAGQLRMDAPYCHRDFRRPVFEGPRDEGLRDILVKRHDAYHGYVVAHSPLDVVGWDGTVYPWAFPILAFQPRVGAVHLPPTWHGTFAAGGALVCSFVPRPLDFHEGAVTCPYPHSNVDVDEVLYYVSGDFTSRTGVGAGSLTLHPRGVPHGPQPGRYEASLGARRTDEVAVMLDCYAPLAVTAGAHNVEDPGYEAGLRGPPEP